MMEHEEWNAALDARLARALPPPRLSPGFRRRLRTRIDQGSRWTLWDAMPDVLHLSGCALLTAACAVALPVAPPVTLAAGAVATLASYVLMTAVRSALEDA